MSKKLFVTSFLTLVIATTLAPAQDTTPPRSWRQETPAFQPRPQPSASTVTAIIVKSWGSNPVWANLNANWSTYGTTAVSIDYTTLIDSDFTYADLVNSNADVLILSDPAGGNQQYSPAEVAAVAKYVEAGHPILATYVTFQNENANVDDRALAPIFGFSSSLTYDFVSISNEFTKLARPCLFNKILHPSWLSEGYPFSQVPSGASWTGNLGTAVAEAQSATYVGVITAYHEKSLTAIYISNMPEFETVGGDDEQLLYNAITCYVTNE